MPEPAKGDRVAGGESKDAFPQWGFNLAVSCEVDHGGGESDLWVPHWRRALGHVWRKAPKIDTKLTSKKWVLKLPPPGF